MPTTMMMTAAVTAAPSTFRPSPAGAAHPRRASTAIVTISTPRRGSTSTVCAFRLRGDVPSSTPSSSSSSFSSSSTTVKVINRAAPPEFEHELGRLEAAGVDVHETGVEYLMEGATGAHVKELQRFLTKTGHYRYKDGITGKETYRTI